ncbi:N-lysine methyltransferase SMYD2 [Fukomys damarensis]|uniref:[histone H3]-lysine(4) N-trimethyltransferase n=1 Tax=Fukomys damarensis TaxID=885580 RepID=A0A091D006_FUKDA|nr:N-lysine methyltransferase SMYD2 [Fukomys damarensis]
MGREDTMAEKRFPYVVSSRDCQIHPPPWCKSHSLPQCPGSGGTARKAKCGSLSPEQTVDEEEKRRGKARGSPKTPGGNGIKKIMKRKNEKQCNSNMALQRMNNLPKLSGNKSELGDTAGPPASQTKSKVQEQKEDWSMHKLECSPMVVFGENWAPSETVRLTARILAKQKTHPERTPSEKLLAVKEFESHLDKLDNEKRDLIQSDIATLHQFYSKHLGLPDHDSLVVLFAQVNCNGFTIEDEELSHLGSAIFPDVALMNHSCCPNVIVTYRGTLAEVRAVQEIHPGEEVFTSYIDLLYPTDDRNDRLRDAYFFTCGCPECSTRDKDEAKVETRKLGDPPRAEAVRDMVRYARSVIEEFRRAKRYKYILELLEICELSQEKMSSVFEDSNVYMLHMMYQAMGVCLYLQDWEGALRYGQKIIKPYSKHYPLYSLNVASMWLKLGRLYLGLENRAAGEKALRKALAIMEVAHGKDHPYISEIRREIEGR